MGYRELAFGPNFDSILFYERSSGRVSAYSLYVARPLVFEVKPINLKEGEPVTATIYFLDQGLKYRVALESSNGKLLQSHNGEASGNFKDSIKFRLDHNDYKLGNLKVHYYIREGNVYHIKHTENIYTGVH
jgi:hypothetical protein